MDTGGIPEGFRDLGKMIGIGLEVELRNVISVLGCGYARRPEAFRPEGIRPRIMVMTVLPP